MAQFTKHFVQDLTQDLKIRQCGTIVFNTDNLSNVITVDLYEGDTPATLSGTVTGAVICSDGSTVPIDNGTISGNTVTMALTEACFAIGGQIGVGIQIVSGSTKTTVLKAIYNAEKFTTDDVVDPDSRITLSVSDLIDDIETAVATIPASYSDLMAAVAPTFSTSTAYSVGQYVWYDGNLYMFTTAHAAGTWNSAHVTAAVIGNELANLKSAVGFSRISIDLSNYNKINGIIQSDATWGGYTSEAYQSVLLTDIPKKISVKCTSGANTRVTFFTQVPSQPNTGISNLYFCDGETGGHTINNGYEETLFVPPDCRCIIITTRINWVNIGVSAYAITEWSDIVTPQMFGAKGDGVTDDTNAFQALNHRTAYIPEGTYIVSKVEYGRKTSLFGAGMGKSVIKQKAEETGDMLDFVNADCSILTNVTLQGQTGETSSNDYRALLKIRTQTGHVSYSNYSNFEHIAILDAPGSGLVLLGAESDDPNNQNSKQNWVHHFNDLRIERAHLWCMIDETSDNRFSNLYLSEGNKGCLLCRKASANMYCNLKIDQPYYAGSGGSLSGYTDGALLVVYNCGNVRFCNIDLQSAYYVGAKIYGSNRIHIDGDINNCGWGANGEGIGITLKNSQSCTCDISFGYVSISQRQKYNVQIETGCSNIAIYANEFYSTYNPNACPDSCFVENPSRISALYNSTPITQQAVLAPNLFVNPLCESFDGWSGTSDFSIDTSGKIVGENSFKAEGSLSTSMSLYQTINNAVAGDYYLFLCVVDVAQAAVNYVDSSNKTVYIVSASDGIDSTVYSTHIKAPNTTGKHLLMGVGRVMQTNTIEPQFHVFKNDGVYYLGNFMAINLNSIGISLPASESMYDALYAQLVELMDSEFDNAQVDVYMDYTQIMNILRSMLQS